MHTISKEYDTNYCRMDFELYLCAMKTNEAAFVSYDMNNELNNLNVFMEALEIKELMAGEEIALLYNICIIW